MKSAHDLKNLKNKNLSGQNVIEYLLVTAVIVLVCFIFYSPTTGPARSALENITEDTVVDIARLNSELKF